MMGEREPLTVLFIAGSGRSGSTLLDRLLGQLPGFVAVGELRYIWREALTGVRGCGCGERFIQCAFWSKVGQVGYGGWDRLDVEAMLRLEATVARQRHLPMLQAPAIWPPFEHRLEAFADVLGRLYRAVAMVSGARVVVDSTKDPAYGSLLRHVPAISLKTVHLVRDSRGVAYSWAKPPGGHGDGEGLGRRFAPPVSAVRWLLYNQLTQALAKRTASTRLRYEDLAKDPVAAIRRLAAFVGEDPAIAGDVVDGGAVHLSTDHTVTGNPNRRTHGGIEVRIDDEWTRSMPRAHRALVLGMTWPLLRRYGYVAAARSAASSEAVIDGG